MRPWPRCCTMCAEAAGSADTDGIRIEPLQVGPDTWKDPDERAARGVDLSPSPGMHAELAGESFGHLDHPP